MQLLHESTASYAVLAYKVQSEWSNEPLALLSAVMYCSVPNAVRKIRLMIAPCMHHTHVLDFLVLHMQCVGMHSADYHVSLHQAHLRRRTWRPDRPGGQALNMQLSFFGQGAASAYQPLTRGYAGAAAGMSL